MNAIGDKHSETKIKETEPKKWMISKEEEVLNQFTELNNELINAQRALAKKNAEITRLNVELKEANASLKEYAYAVSHDLKEPLRMIVGFISRLKKKYATSLDEKANLYIDTAIDGGSRMQKMITDLLELSHIAKADTPKEMTDFTSVLQEVQINLHVLIEETEATIVVNSSLPALFVNRSDMLRLFQNMISNAIKFKRKGIAPLIMIEASEKTNEWEFIVKDNGIGIEAKDIEKIFQIFQRLHSREEYEGSGIGLSMCKKIIVKHGGVIAVDSNINEGTNFRFTLQKIN